MAGTDITPGHLASWAGVSPGNNRSADKSKRSPVKKGNASLQSALVEAAGRRPNQDLLGSPIPPPRTSAPTGPPWPLPTPLLSLHSIIKNKVPFVDGTQILCRPPSCRAVRQLERLGHKVILQAA